MFRVLLLCLAFFAASQLSSAQTFPKFPQQNHVTTAAHVKKSWVRMLLWEARVTRSSSAKQSKRALIREIEAGLHDDYALLLALRSNEVYLAFHRRRQELQETKNRIAALLNPAPKIAEAVVWPAPRIEPIPRGPVVPMIANTGPKPQPEVIYEEVEICPPEELEAPPQVVRPRPSRPQRQYVSPLRFKPWPVGQRPNQTRYPTPNPQSSYPGHSKANPVPARRPSRPNSPPSSYEPDPQPEPQPAPRPSRPSSSPSRPSAPCPASPPPRSDPRLVPHDHPVRR